MVGSEQCTESRIDTRIQISEMNLSILEIHKSKKSRRERAPVSKVNDVVKVSIEPVFIVNSQFKHFFLIFIDCTLRVCLFLFRNVQMCKHKAANVHSLSHKVIHSA